MMEQLDGQIRVTQKVRDIVEPHEKNALLCRGAWINNSAGNQLYCLQGQVTSAQYQVQDNEQASQPFSFSAHENDIMYLPGMDAFVQNNGGGALRDWIERLRQIFHSTSWAEEATHRSMVADAVNDIKRNKHGKFIVLDLDGSFAWKSWTLADMKNVIYHYAATRGEIPFVNADNITAQVDNDYTKSSNNNNSNEDDNKEDEDKMANSLFEYENVSNSGCNSMAQLSGEVSDLESRMSLLSFSILDETILSKDSNWNMIL